VADLATAVVRCGAGDCRVVLQPDAEQSLSALVVRAATTKSTTTVLIGPEGGFDADELAAAREHGFTACRLGPRVLRAETAPLAALTVIQTLIGDLGR
jgi:16S rRNA (uracil1498-N3)-methyltransferase